ncbi:hypothetical protein GXW83_14635 [Streptacidiphilus sp. PB12-B1b]|uniref:hypothetical protein n=1 Tax=Streptacidiphilus sp. PB12-B1b TaxID=2705012 RepID=UPI0015F9925B|nr:hypothetical protein [Streptacidiphilus sp. PB12-B1b]QMU76790.1 hypothetical protein GXW83_14635 [Streptacidiphilus sp. PB12-B1b]
MTNQPHPPQQAHVTITGPGRAADHIVAALAARFREVDVLQAGDAAAVCLVDTGLGHPDHGRPELFADPQALAHVVVTGPPAVEDPAADEGIMLLDESPVAVVALWLKEVFATREDRAAEAAATAEAAETSANGGRRDRAAFDVWPGRPAV